MILADTSVWIELFRHGGRTLRELLEEGQIVTHELILGELACGSLNDRRTTLRLLKQLPSIPPARHQEVMDFVEANQLHSLGLGWIDMHLWLPPGSASVSYTRLTEDWARPPDSFI